MDQFSDIRPYNDDEVNDVVHRLIHDQEFIAAILRYKMPFLSKFFSWPLNIFIAKRLAKECRQISTVHDVQMRVATYMEMMLSKTIDRLETKGLDKLDPQLSYLFVSNHRDIAMDPALVNWCLHQHGFKTVRIAIGDNLLKKNCVTDLMRLNKSFIVKRSSKAPRDMLNAFSQLSAYIRHSLDEGESIWIAQKEGRAKDGNDYTDPAILKMFYMEGRKRKLNFEEYLSSLRIVPVTISYEYDPCDLLKANEIFQKQTNGYYEKSEFEDIENIIRGITGKKGKVSVVFGDVIDSPSNTPQELAKQIDQQIYQNYQFYPSNYIAAKIDTDLVSEQDFSNFEKRLAFIPDPIREIVETMYASPMMKK